MWLIPALTFQIRLSTLESSFFKYEFEPNEFPTEAHIPIAIGALSATKI